MLCPKCDSEMEYNERHGDEWYYCRFCGIDMDAEQADRSER